MVRLTKIILTFLIVIFSFQAQAKNPPPGTGTADIPANILIMLDNSGSMSAKLYSSVQVYYPLDVATDSSGNVYVMEYYNNRIKVFDSSGAYLRTFGGYGSGCTRWRYARQFDIYDDKIYIADTFGHQIKVLNLTGGCIDHTTLAYTYPHAIAVTAKYIYVGHSGRRIWIHQRNRINHMNNHDAGSNLSYSWGMSVSGTRLVIGDYSKNRLVEFRINTGASFSNGGQGMLTYLQASTTTYSSSNGYFRRPTDAAYDSNGNVYGLDLYNHRIQKFNSSLSYQAKTGSYSTSSGFRYPYGMHIDSSDNIYVTDFYNYAVRKYNTSLTETATYGGGSGTRLDAAKKVIKKIVSNTDLTSGANFGLMEWGTRHNIRVKISDTGAKTIYTNVDGVYASGGTNLNVALRKVRDYFRSGDVANWNLSCSLNYLIVISDGYWVSHGAVLNTATNLKNENIKTFAVGFALGGASSNYSQLATAGGTTKPLYASNETELLAKLTDAIKQAISGKLTFTTPAVMSDVTKGNYVYQSTFEYSKNKQWTGNLKKYKLNSNGTFGSVQWDAADKLNSKNASSRKIWTTGISTTGTNNFTTTYRDDLKPLLFPSQSPTDTEVDNLINFIRGVDTYDQDNDSNKTESIHKLADIYHSELVVVGPPESSAADTGNANFQKTDAYYRSQKNYDNFKNGKSCGGNCATRTEVILAGANNGILHAFKTSDGEELWGYVPPNILGNFERIPSSKANATNPIYGVDGSPVVKDIYFDDTPNDSTDNPRWRTILLGALGAGGQGLYALDITDINNPTHLFAVEHDGDNQAIKHWDVDGLKSEFGYRSGSIEPKYDYRKLGETWSTPRIIRIKVDGKDKWVAVFGGGYNGAVNPNYGSAVFVMDLEDEGRLLKVIDIEDSANVMHNYVFGTTNPNTKTEFNLATYGLTSYNINCCKIKVYGAGSIRYTITGDQVGDTMQNLKLKFDSAPPGGIILTASKVNKTDIINSIPADLTVITADGTSKANYDGALVYAADLEGKISKINLTENFTLNSDKVISNVSKMTLFQSQSTSDNGRYIYKKPSATILNDNKLWLYFGTGNTQKLQEQSSSIQNRVYGIKDKDFPSFVNRSAGSISQCKTAPTCPSGTDLGWYVNLKNAQKLTAESTIDKDRVYFPLYEPAKTDKCGIGNAILTAYNTKCGNSVLNVNLGKGVLSKVVVQNDNLYIGIAGEANKNASGFTTTGNLITGKSKATGGAGKVQLEGWREN